MHVEQRNAEPLYKLRIREPFPFSNISGTQSKLVVFQVRFSIILMGGMSFIRFQVPPRHIIKRPI